MTGIVYNIIDSYSSYKTEGKLWNDQNLIVEGQLKLRNLLAFFAYSLNYFLI